MRTRQPGKQWFDTPRDKMEEEENARKDAKFGPRAERDAKLMKLYGIDAEKLRAQGYVVDYDGIAITIVSPFYRDIG